MISNTEWAVRVALASVLLLVASWTLVLAVSLR
jgi:hypothetical protein